MTISPNVGDTISYRLRLSENPRDPLKLWHGVVEWVAQDDSQPLLRLAKRNTQGNKNQPGAKMTTTCYIISPNQHQHKLRNSKKLARNMRAIYPKIPSIPETPETLETLETVSHLDSNLCALIGHKPAVGANALCSPSDGADIQSTRLKWYDIAMRLMQTSSFTS